MGFEAGRLTAAETVDPALSALDVERITTRRDALDTLVAVTGTRPDRATDVFDETMSAVGTGAVPNRAELAAIGTLGQEHPRAFTALVETFGSLLANADESSVDPASLSAVLGAVGDSAPGVVKPVLGTLVEQTDTSRPSLRNEAAWAVVRISTREPAMLRPLIAGLVWDLEVDDPEVVQRAAAMLGQIGRYLPNHLAGLDRLASLLDHPVSEVRAEAIEAFGKIAGTGSDPVTGTPDPEQVEPFLDAIAAQAGDQEPAVRAATIETLGQVARHDRASAEAYASEFLRRAADRDRAVQIAALEALAQTFDASIIDDDALWRYVVPQLTRKDDDVVAATVDVLLTAVRSLATERPATARRITDLLAWFQLSSHGGFGVPDPLEDLDSSLVSLVDVDLYLRVARSLREADDIADRHAVVSICTTVAIHSETHRLRAIGVLQALLADDDENVRRDVLDAFERLADDVPSLGPVLAPMARTVVAYDPPVRQQAVSVLRVTGWAADPDRLGPVAVQCHVLQDRRKAAEDGDEGDMSDELDIGKSEQYPLRELARTRPRAVADVAPTLLDHISVGGEHAASVARTLAIAVAAGGEIPPATVRETEDAVQSEDVSLSVLAWLSTLQLLADGEAFDERARDRLHSLAERRDETPLLSCLDLLVDHRPAAVAALLLSVPAGETLAADRSRSLADIVTAHPRLLLRNRTVRWTGAPRKPTGGGQRRTNWLSTLAARAPSTVPASDWLATGFWKDDGEETATLLSTVARADALDDSLDLAALRHHPDPAVRDTVDRFEADETDVPSIDVSTPTVETVEALASRLASPSRGACRRASEGLVSVAVENPSLRTAVRQHLLASTVALDETAAPRVVLGALATVAPRPPHQAAEATASSGRSPAPKRFGGAQESASTELTNDVVPLLCRYAAEGSTGVRDVALSALRAQPAGGSDAVATVLRARLRDVDAVVRAQAARTVGVLVGDGLDVTPEIVDALVDALDGPRYVTIAACAALGHCGASAPSTTERVTDVLETRLRARERGVRRAAARGIERIGYAEPDALLPVVETLCDRVLTDRVTWPALLPALSVAPVSDRSVVRRLVKPALSALVAETEPPVTRAAGRLLVTASSEVPGVVHRRLVSVGEQLHEEFDDDIVSGFRDISPSALSTYWLFRAVGRCARENHTATAPIDWALSETVAYLGPSSDSSPSHDLPRDNVTVDGLSRVTARAAGFGGNESYATILAEWPSDPTKPSLDPAATAAFLVRTDAALRGEALETIATGVGSDHRDEVLVRLLDQPINLNRYEAVFDALTRLLPETDDRRLHRLALDALLDACEAHNWELRVNAIETIVALGATTTLAADEAIAHLLGLTDGGVQTREALVDALVELLDHATIAPVTICQSTVAAYERSARWPERRRTAVATLGRLAERYAAVRVTAVGTLADALVDSDRWVRERAATALTEIAEIDPDALGPHREQVEHVAETADGTVADTLEPCLTGIADSS